MVCVLGGSQLRLFDVHDPANPVLRRAIEISSTADSVALQNGHAFVSDREHGLEVLSIVDPTRIQRKARTPFPISGNRSHIQIDGRYAVIAGGAYGFRFFDISDPSRPIPAAGFPDKPPYSYNASAGAISGTNVLLAGIERISLFHAEEAPAAHPRLVTAFNAPANRQFHNIVVDGSRAYASVSGGKTLILDLSDPVRPAQIGSLPAGVTAAHGNIVAAEYEFFDVSNPRAPIRLGQGEVPSPPLGGASLGQVRLSGNRAYVSIAWPFPLTIHVVDPRDPTHPIVVQPASVTGWIMDVVGTFAYVLVGLDNELLTLNLADPANPIVLSRWQGESRYFSINVHDSRAYLLGQDFASVLDVSNPAQPTQIARFEIPVTTDYPSLLDPKAVVITPRRVYTGDNGLQIYDAINSSRIDWVGGFLLPGRHPLAVSGNYAYLATPQKVLTFHLEGGPAEPTMSIDFSAGGVVRWPDYFSDFKLHSTPSVTASSSPVADSSESIEGFRVQPISTNESSRFFFLRR
jgi:hypothetical protein